MNNNTPLTDMINTLIIKINETTGKNDLTLSDAINTLIEEYNRNKN